MQPRARISWVVDVRASAILKGSPAIDELIEIDSRRWRSGLFERKTVEEARLCLRQLRGHADQRGSGSGQACLAERLATRPDVAIDFQGLVKSGLIALLSGANRRVGFASSDLREKSSRYLLTDQIPAVRAVHVIDKNIVLAESIFQTASESVNDGLSTSNGTRRYEFPIAISPADQQYIDDVVQDAPRAAIINAGGGWPTKLWPAARYAELADWLWNEYEMKSFVTYGPGEEGLATEVVSASRSGRCHALNVTLKQFVALARRAILFVGGDTGPLHLAAAVATPIVGIYGPTAPERNGPFNTRDITVGRDLWCRTGCHRRKCWHWECMEIPTVEVKRAINVRLSPDHAASGNGLGNNYFSV
jgi:ADP-heptose:LPS heptosyltransferase